MPRCRQNSSFNFVEGWSSEINSKSIYDIVLLPDALYVYLNAGRNCDTDIISGFDQRWCNWKLKLAQSCENPTA